MTEANHGLRTIKTIRDVLKGNDAELSGMRPSEISSFKYAPVTSVEVERSFSKLKLLLSDRRHSLKMDNIRSMLVIACNEP